MSAPHMHGDEGDRGDLRFPRVGRWGWVGTTRLSVVGVAAAV